MGTSTPNISIFKPSPGETVYDPAFSAGLDNIDAHDHTGGPRGGKQLGTNSIQDGSITPEKLSEEIIAEVTVQTLDATPTEAVSIPIAESQSITVVGRFNALRSTATESIGGEFSGVFHRPTGSSVQAVNSYDVSIKTNSSGMPSFQLIADTVNEAISLRAVGEASKTIDWHIAYNIIAQPES